ncbi:MAG: hypothetical protein V4636_12990 [Pseudomonadota bacterium]
MTTAPGLIEAARLVCENCSYDDGEGMCVDEDAMLDLRFAVRSLPPDAVVVSAALLREIADTLDGAAEMLDREGYEGRAAVCGIDAKRLRAATGVSFSEKPNDAGEVEPSVNPGELTRQEDALRAAYCMLVGLHADPVLLTQCRAALSPRPWQEPVFLAPEQHPGQDPQKQIAANDRNDE